MTAVSKMSSAIEEKADDGPLNGPWNRHSFRSNFEIGETLNLLISFHGGPARPKNRVMLIATTVYPDFAKVCQSEV